MLPELDHVRFDQDGPVTWLVLNRPDRLNALNGGLLDDLATALDATADDEQTRVIVIRGAGRAFCSGYDIERDEDEIGGLHSRSVVEDRRRLERNVEIFLRAWRHPKPVIAAVHGFCMAGGSQLATLCDLTVVAEDAQIGVPSIPVGGGYVSPMWVPLVGPKRAKQMSFQAGQRITGATAAQWGWANYAVPADDLFEDVARLAQRIALTPGEVLTIKKAAINRAADIMGWSTIMPLGAETDAFLHNTRSVQRLNELIMRDGLKETIRAFGAGELDLADGDLG
jgi:enoyl-CoA hydratase/carnithine racemase